MSVSGKASNLQQTNLRQFIASGTTSPSPQPAPPVDSFSSLDVQSVDEVPMSAPSSDYVEVLDPVAHANEGKGQEGNAGNIPTIGAAIVHSVRPSTADSTLDSARMHANSLHEIVSARARSPLASSRAVASARARSPLANVRTESRGAILAGGGGSQYGYDSRPTSPVNMPLRHHGSASRMEDGATTTDAGMADTSYTPPSLGMLWSY